MSIDIDTNIRKNVTFDIYHVTNIHKFVTNGKDPYPYN
jgi:hypothetical protein